jgi:hypothetical protein
MSDGSWPWYLLREESSQLWFVLGEDQVAVAGDKREVRVDDIARAGGSAQLADESRDPRPPDRCRARHCRNRNAGERTRSSGTRRSVVQHVTVAASARVSRLSDPARWRLVSAAGRYPRADAAVVRDARDHAVAAGARQALGFATVVVCLGAAALLLIPRVSMPVPAAGAEAVEVLEVEPLDIDPASSPAKISVGVG